MEERAIDGDVALQAEFVLPEQALLSENRDDRSRNSTLRCIVGAPVSPGDVHCARLVEMARFCDSRHHHLLPALGLHGWRWRPRAVGVTPLR